MSQKIRRYKDLGPLQTLLLKACPANEKGTKSIPLLAKALKTSHQYVYRWIDDNCVPPKFVKKIVELMGDQDNIPDEDKVTLKDFHPYVF